MQYIKRIINDTIQKAVYRYRYSSKSYINYIKKCGVTVGDRVFLFGPTQTVIDITNPNLLSIGDDVQIAHGVTILTHDYGWAVLKGVYGEVLGATGEVIIGNNCFIGANTTILRNTHIGDNVIIGANSLVTGTVPNNSVFAGNPAKFIMSLDDYYSKRKKNQINEAKTMYLAYKNKHLSEPDIDLFNEYFWLFTNKKDDLTPRCIHQMKNCGNFDYSYSLFEKHIPEYNGLNDMINSFKNSINN